MIKLFAVFSALMVIMSSTICAENDFVTRQGREKVYLFNVPENVGIFKTDTVGGTTNLECVTLGTMRFKISACDSFKLSLSENLLKKYGVNSIAVIKAIEEGSGSTILVKEIITKKNTGHDFLPKIEKNSSRLYGWKENGKIVALEEKVNKIEFSWVGMISALLIISLPAFFRMTLKNNRTTPIAFILAIVIPIFFADDVRSFSFIAVILANLSLAFAGVALVWPLIFSGKKGLAIMFILFFCLSQISILASFYFAYGWKFGATIAVIYSIMMGLLVIPTMNKKVN